MSERMWFDYKTSDPEEYIKPVFKHKLVKQIGRVEYKEDVLKLSKEEEERARVLHQESIVFDLHTHPWVWPENIELIEEWQRICRYPMGFEGIKASGLTGYFDGFGTLARISTYLPWVFEDHVMDIGMRFAQIGHHRDKMVRAFNAEDVATAKKEGKCAIFVGFENAAVIENRLDRLDLLYGLGLRMCGLTYNDRNLIGDGCGERTDTGLSNFGLDVVARMNNLNMIIDLSHSGYKTSMEAIEVSKDPVTFSHNGAKALNPESGKMRKDEEIKAMAEKGGIIGIETVPNVLSTKERQGINDVLDHVDYCVKLVGADHVGIGCDISFGDHVGLHRYDITHAVGRALLLKSGLGVGGLRAKYMEGIENPSEWPNITRGLVLRGYSDQEIKKIIGANAVKFVEKVIG